MVFPVRAASVNISTVRIVAIISTAEATALGRELDQVRKIPNAHPGGTDLDDQWSSTTG